MSLNTLKFSADIETAVSSKGILDFAIEVMEQYRSLMDIEERRSKGQIFTPKEVAAYMASLISIDSDSISLLDPGAGSGILSAAVCERVLKSGRKGISLSIDLYENDSYVIPYLKKVLDHCRIVLENAGHILSYTVFEEDFIMQNYSLLESRDNLNLFQMDSAKYDAVISNPPYFKLNKDSLQSLAMKHLVHGQPNIYPFFMALSLSMLKKNGELVFITPRSFCSGLYFKRFRTWFLQQTELSNIHNFISRNLVFKDDNILQENVILKSVKAQRESDINVGVSTDHSFHDYRSFQVKKDMIVFCRNGDLFIRIPSSGNDLMIADLIDSWKNHLNDFGFEISTGPVVSFRAKEYIHKNLNPDIDVPFLWMHNLKDWHTVWPVEKNGKADSIKVGEQSMKLLLPVRNYVLLKRFTSKEQKRRLYASVMLEKNFSDFKYIGIENHINYVYRFRKRLSEEEAFGIAGILNTALVDSYFRSLNGNTQVNATDIRCMPFPPLNSIVEIGNAVINNNPCIGLDLDLLVAEILDIDKSIVYKLYKEADLNE